MKITKKFLKNKYLKEKKSINQIAKEIGYGHTTILNYLKKYKIKRRTNKEAHTGKLGANYKDGRTLKSNHCKDCGKEISHYKSIRCSSCASKGKLNGMFGKRGKLSPFYMEDLIREYPLKFTNYLKSKIRNRDNHICQGENCDMTEEEHIIVYGQVLDIHHIDYDKQNCSEENLITLCRQCNLRANYNKDYWKEYFINIVEKLI